MNGDYADVGDRWTGSPGEGLHVIDIRNPATPLAVGVFPVDVEPTGARGVNGIQVVGNLAYLADIRNGLRILDMTVPTNPALLILEVSDPAKPVLVGTYRSGAQPYAVEVAGNHAFVAECAVGDPSSPTSHPAGLAVVDVSDPANPTLVTKHILTGLSPPSVGAWAAELRVSGNVVGVTCAEGLALFQFEAPSNPRLNPPVLSANTVTLSWTGGPSVKLQRTTNLNNPNWQEVPGSEGVSQIQLARSDPAAFFRLSKP